MPKALPAGWPSTVEAALTLLKTAAEIDALDLSKDAMLTLQLEQYAAIQTDGGATVYQPYFNAALFISETPSRQIIHKAGDGVEFNRSENSVINEPAIRTLVRKQMDFNTIYGIESPIDLEDWLTAACNKCGSVSKNLYGIGAFLT